jgi:hypothetical protein
LTFFINLPIWASQEAQEMLKRFFAKQAGFYFYSFSGIMVCLQES